MEGNWGYLLNLETLNQKTIMADMECLKTQSSENHGEFFQVNKNQVLQITEVNKPTYPSLRLLLSLEMSISSLHRVPVIRPDLKSEVSVSD
ncbi:zinc finger protein 468, partial [Biomphalaria glabrata]